MESSGSCIVKTLYGFENIDQSFRLGVRDLANRRTCAGVVILGLLFSMGLTLAERAFAETKKIDYQGFTLWLNCDKRAATRFAYSLGPDSGDEKRKNYQYRLDASLGDCQQLSTRSYWSETGEVYQRGHLVPFNHLDFSPKSAFDANQMANILPQHKIMNWGAWKATEEITECSREFGGLYVVGGAIWDEELRILKEHGVDIPDLFWKVIFQSGDSIAWIIPNDDSATAEAADSFIVTLSEIEQRVSYLFDISSSKTTKSVKSWSTQRCKDIEEWRR